MTPIFGEKINAVLGFVGMITGSVALITDGKWITSFYVRRAVVIDSLTYVHCTGKITPVGKTALLFVLFVRLVHATADLPKVCLLPQKAIAPPTETHRLQQPPLWRALPMLASERATRSLASISVCASNASHKRTL